MKETIKVIITVIKYFFALFCATLCRPLMLINVAIYRVLYRCYIWKSARAYFLYRCAYYIKVSGGLIGYAVNCLKDYLDDENWCKEMLDYKISAEEIASQIECFCESGMY